MYRLKNSIKKYATCERAPSLAPFVRSSPSFVYVLPFATSITNYYNHLMDKDYKYVCDLSSAPILFIRETSDSSQICNNANRKRLRRTIGKDVRRGGASTSGLLLLGHLQEHRSGALGIGNVNLQLVRECLELVEHLGAPLPTRIRWRPNIVQWRLDVLPAGFRKGVLLSAERSPNVIGRRNVFRRRFRVHARTLVERWLDRWAVIVIQQALHFLQQLLAVLLQLFVH